MWAGSLAGSGHEGLLIEFSHTSNTMIFGSCGPQQFDHDSYIHRASIDLTIDDDVNGLTNRSNDMRGHHHNKPRKDTDRSVKKHVTERDANEMDMDFVDKLLSESIRLKRKCKASYIYIAV